MMNLRWLWGSVLLAAACSDGGEVHSSAASAGSDASAEQSSAAEGGEALEAEAVCRQMEQATSRSFERWQQCDSDDDCVLEDLQLGCVEPFLCTEVINRDSERTALMSDARALIAAYMARCSCAIADCGLGHEARAFCDRERGVCDLR